jgi:hypothetical protein
MPPKPRNARNCTPRSAESATWPSLTSRTRLLLPQWTHLLSLALEVVMVRSLFCPWLPGIVFAFDRTGNENPVAMRTSRTPCLQRAFCLTPGQYGRMLLGLWAILVLLYKIARLVVEHLL